MPSQYHCPVIDLSFEEYPMLSQYHCPVINIVLRTSHAFPVSLSCCRPFEVAFPSIIALLSTLF